MKFVKANKPIKLQSYEIYALLSRTVRLFREEAQVKLKALEGRTIWHVSSTAQGGGVAEMLQNIIGLLSEFNVSSQWVVLQTDEIQFYDLTKRIHNLIHGKPGKPISGEEKNLYERVNKENALKLIPHLKDGDIIIIHDPQPMALVRDLLEVRNVKVIWRCHIGLNRETRNTQEAWEFLKNYFPFYDHFVFTDKEYVPKGIPEDKVTIIPPGIDPLSHKNRRITLNKISGILRNAELINSEQPNISSPFKANAKRLRQDGSLGSPLTPQQHGLMYRPIVTQISRWDRLKGFVPLINAFIHLKKNIDNYKGSKMHLRRLQSVRLILGGPDPNYISDDPEGIEVLNELKDIYKDLPAEIAKEIAIIMLPMESVKENALIVNALQGCSTIVVQNSLQEGFGLTATEAMWKQVPVMGSHACGLKAQIRDRVDGCLVQDPENPEEVAKTLNYMLKHNKKREAWASNGQKRVRDEFLIFNQLKKWMYLFPKVI